MGHTADHPSFHELVAADAPLEPVASGGFAFIEGPLWDRRSGSLLFSDIPASVIRRWQDGTVSEWRRPTNLSNALTYDAAGSLLICEHVPPGVRRVRPDGSEEIMASHWQGRELNSPNDVVARTDGSVYFTDPPSGRTAEWGVERPQELDFQGVFRVAPDGGLELIDDQYTVPNGLCLSPDERTLYVNDSIQAVIRAYELAPDGSSAGGQVSRGRVVAEGIRNEDLYDGCPDGLKCDVHGNLYCSGPGGVWVFSPAGERLGVIAAPEFITNFNWGGPDHTELFLCGFQTLYRLQTNVRGSGIPGTR